LNSEIEKDYYVKILAQKLMLEANLIYRELRAADNAPNPVKKNKTQISRDNIQYGNYSKDEKILAAMLKSPKIFARIKASLGLNFFARPEYATMVNCYNRLEGSGEKKLQQLGEIMNQEGLAASYARIIFLMEDLDIDEAQISEFIRRVQAIKMEARWQKIYQQIIFLRSEGDFNHLLKFILNLDIFLNKTREGGIE
jgi:DNA primase